MTNRSSRKLLLKKDDNNRKKKFIVDRMYYRLAKWLRILGYDTLFQQSYTDEDYLTIAQKEGRILITRDEALKRKAEKVGVTVHTVDASTVEERLTRLSQLTDIALTLPTKTLPRCTVCNAVIKEVAKEKIAKVLQPQTRAVYNHFWQCTNPHCQKIYWKGPHWTKMAQTLEECRKALNEKKNT